MQVNQNTKAKTFEWNVTVEPRRTINGHESLSSKGSSSSGQSQRSNSCRANGVQR
jgi:hypothetical protein